MTFYLIQPPRARQSPALYLPHTATLPPPAMAQTSVPKGPVSGCVPSLLEARPSIWLLPTGEGADTVQENA